MDSNVNPKVYGATGAGGVGAALAVILTEVLEGKYGDLSTSVEGAIMVLVTALAAFAGGYITRGPK